MRCANCGESLGVNFLRCPRCGTKVPVGAANSGRVDSSQGALEDRRSERFSASTAAVVLEERRAPFELAQPMDLAHPPSLHTLPPVPRSPLLRGAAILALAAAVLTAGAFALSGDVKGTVTAGFDGSWDRVSLTANFAMSSWVRERTLDATPEFEISRSDGSVIYTGIGPVATVNDAGLGSGEVLQVKACAPFRAWYERAAQSVCATSVLKASSKRFAPITMMVSYPRGGAVELPRIAFQQALQREAFGQASDWVRLRATSDPVRLKVWVSAAPGDAVQLTITPANSMQPVDLTGGDGFASFQSAYRRAEANAADVVLQFEFHTSTAPDAAAYPVQSVTLRGKTQEERLREVQDMAERAARHIVSNHYGGGRRLHVEIQEWKFDPAGRVYGAFLKVSWSGRDDASNSYWIQGRFAATETRDKSQFELVGESHFPVLVRMWANITIKVGDVVRDVL